MKSFESIDLDPNNYDNYNTYHQKVNAHVKDFFDGINDVYTLKMLFWKCHQNLTNNPNLPQDKLTWINIHYEARMSTMFRLGEIKTPEAAQTVVKLRFEPDAGWDGGSALFASTAVVRSGKAAIPYLKEIDHPEARRLIKLINAGATSAL